MDGKVAQRTRLEKRRLIMEGGGSGRAAEARSRVALQAEQIHIAKLEHVWIGAAMNHVTRYAAVHLDRRVLVDKRALLVGVAFEADGVLRGGHAHLLKERSSVHVVTVAASNQALVHAMVEGHGELRLLREVAGVAKLRLRFGQQEFLGLRVVGRMAGSASHAILRVDGIEGPYVLGAAGMAIQASGVDLRRGRILEHKNLGLVPAAIHVRFSRAVTRFTTMPLRPFPGVERGHKVRRIFVRLEETFGWHILVACLADFGAYVERGIGRTCVLGRFVGVAPGLGGPFGHQQKHDDDQGEEKAATRDQKVLHLTPHFVATVAPGSLVSAPLSRHDTGHVFGAQGAL